MFNTFKAHRNLLKNLVVRELKHRYVGSIGGFLWSVIHPLALLLSYSFLFSIMGQRLGPDRGTNSFAIFFFCGFLPWLMFSDTVMRSCSSIVEQKNLITKTIIPAEVLPMSITISTLVHHVIGLAILIVALGAFYSLHFSTLFILLYMPMLLMLSQGVGWIVAGLQVFLRDTVQALQVIMLLWFWFTPVFYPPDQVHSKAAQLLLKLNPMAAIVTGYRNALLHLQPPDVRSVVTLFAICISVFAAGALLFRQAKPVFADVL